MEPFGVAVATSGEIYIADSSNDRIRKLLPIAVQNIVAVGGTGTQAGVPGTRFTVSVKASDASGIPVSGAVVTFAVTSGSATVSPTTAITGADGVATSSVVLGDVPGPVVITASTSGSLTLTFRFTVNPAIVIPVPKISAGGIVGAGLTIPAKRTVAVGGIASISARISPIRRVAKWKRLTW